MRKTRKMLQAELDAANARLNSVNPETRKALRERAKAGSATAQAEIKALKEKMAKMQTAIEAAEEYMRGSIEGDMSSEEQIIYGMLTEFAPAPAAAQEVA